jgi:uncharacterized membrane-anchored protein
MTVIHGHLDFALFAEFSYKRGDRVPELEPRHVAVDDGDGTTYVYGFEWDWTPELRAEFLEWLPVVFEKDNHDATVTGNLPYLAMEYAPL